MHLLKVKQDTGRKMNENIWSRILHSRGMIHSTVWVNCCAKTALANSQRDKTFSYHTENMGRDVKLDSCSFLLAHMYIVKMGIWSCLAMYSSNNYTWQIITHACGGYNQSITGEHMQGGSKSCLPYGTIPSGHASQASMQAPFPYQVTLSRMTCCNHEFCGHHCGLIHAGLSLRETPQ